MAASQELLALSKRLLKLENKLRKLEIEGREICTNEDKDDVALSNSIAKNEEKKLLVHSDIQDLLKKILETAQRAIRFDADELMLQRTALLDHYFALIERMRKHLTTDEEGKEVSLWELFQREHPFYFLWFGDCN